MKDFPKFTGAYLLFGGGEIFPFRKLLLAEGIKGYFFNYKKIIERVKDVDKFLRKLTSDLYKMEYVFFFAGDYVSAEQDAEYFQTFYSRMRELSEYVTVVGSPNFISRDDLNIRYSEVGKSFGLRICPTLYKWTTWKNIVNSYDIVGVTYNTKEEPRISLPAVLDIAVNCKRLGIKLHGYSRTSKHDLRRVEWFSVNSGNWMGSRAFGNRYIFHPKGEIMTFHKQAKLTVRRRLYPLCIKYGLDYDLIWQDAALKDIKLPKDISQELDRLAINSFKELGGNLLKRNYYHARTKNY